MTPGLGHHREESAVSSTTEPLNTSTLLARMKSRLQAVYEDRLRGVVLYGSCCGLIEVDTEIRVGR